MNRFRTLYENFTFPKVDNYHLPDDIKGDVLVDIGGCKGEFTETYKDKFNECFIFEASYENSSFINKKILEDEWTNTSVFNLAVSDITGDIVKLYANNRDRGSGSIIGGSTHTGNYTNVFTIDFNNIFNFLGIEQIDLLKIDCEGGEYKFLPSSNLEKVNMICIELHAWEGYADKIDDLQNHILTTHDLIYNADKGHRIQTYKRKTK